MTIAENLREEGKKEELIETIIVLLENKFRVSLTSEIKKYIEDSERKKLTKIREDIFDIESLNEAIDILTIGNGIPDYVEDPRTIADKLKREGFIEGYAEVLINRLREFYSIFIPEESEKLLLNAGWSQIKDIENNINEIDDFEDIKAILNKGRLV
ncbi:hypothetical protein [Natronospora cellulosivora (SeqCode)]